MLKRNLVALALAGGIGSTLGGCLIAGSNATYETGRRVSGTTLSQIEIGKTTESWLLATLGEPTARNEVAGKPEVEILRYDYRRREESSGAVFLLFAGSSSNSTGSSTYFEVTDGIVTSYWTES